MKKIHNITVFAILLLWSCIALAAATVIAVNGDTQMTPLKGSPDQLAPGQRIEVGTVINTGKNSDISMRFDDGQLIALSPNTSLVINEYKFNANKPEESSFAISLLKGGMRAVTGIIGETNKDNVFFKTEVATIVNRSADFQLFYDNQLYITILDGAILARNESGESIFDAKSQPIGYVVDALTIPKSTTSDRLPVAATDNFRALQMKSLSDTSRKPNPYYIKCKE